MRLSAPPTATTASRSERRGKALFGTRSDPGIGCVLRPSDSLTTGEARFSGMASFDFQPFSDLALHHMGSELADSIAQVISSAPRRCGAPASGSSSSTTAARLPTTAAWSRRSLRTAAAARRHAR